MKNNIYFENLNGLRFMSFISVFFYHSFYTEFKHIKDTSFYHFIKTDIFGNGNLGVNFFFVLSGFLITYLLIEEKKTVGQINITKFWMRRVLKIWPLFYACVFFGFLIFPWIKKHFGITPHETANPLFYVTFINNFDFINKGLPDASILGVLWSVAIEEQFYFIWPIIIYFFTLKKLWIPFLFFISISIIFSAVYDSPLLNEHHTLSCIGDMTIGASGAWLIQMSIRFKNYIKGLSKVQISLIYIVALFLFLYREKILSILFVTRIFERFFIAVVFIMIILEQTFSRNSLFKLSKFKTISNLGNITYGLYCLHFIGILIAIKLTAALSLNIYLWQVVFIEPILSLAITIIISKISFHYFELPFLKLKAKFSS
jgi:peptidoglycan/LPS O-acetylase OafA/YrhL